VPPPATLAALLAHAATEAPGAVAFRYRDETITYGDWHGLSAAVAAGFTSRGIGRGDVVALLLPSTPLYLICYLAAARLGAVTTGINVRYRRGEIRHILARSGAALLVAVDEWHGTDFRAALGSVRGDVPDLREVVWVGGDEVCAGTRDTITRHFGTRHFGSGAPGADAARPEDAAAIVWTSGTTGVPKGAWYAHASLTALAAIEARRHPDGLPRGQMHLAAGLSFAHVGTMARVAVQIGSLGHTIIHDAFDVEAVLRAIEAERLAHFGAIPTQAIMLLDHPRRAAYDLSCLRTVLLGGAPASPELIRRVQDTLGVRVAVRYSSTEVGIATGSLPDDPIERLSTTVGKPTPGVELRIVDDTNAPRPAGESGQVTIRSPATMRGYWRDPEATARTLDAHGWVHTGDLGWLDTDGYLHLLGRQSEMFIRGGFNVYPAEIEDLLGQHPQVARAAVVGVPDETLGEAGWAFVVPADAARPPTLDELRAWVGAELASFKRPDRLTVLAEMPVTPMFKVDKRALAALAGR
jgi:acyl-CoA synthetase (AMP-forming)/AMP-acid ligase II